jgi:hypothetical protein
VADELPLVQAPAGHDLEPVISFGTTLVGADRAKGA